MHLKSQVKIKTNIYLKAGFNENASPDTNIQRRQKILGFYTSMY